MESGDGLIVRVRTGARPLSLSDARALAELAREFGNGQIELTRRANLQLRGVSDRSLAALQAGLVERGLATANAACEARLSLLVHPLSELDAACAGMDGLAHALETALAAASDIGPLPAKFGLVLDTERGDLAHLAADLRMCLSGQMATLFAASENGPVPLGSCHASEAPEVVVRWLRKFTAAGGEHLRSLAEKTPATLCALGFQRGLRSWLACFVPFGAATAEQWTALVTLAEQAGASGLRITPERSLLLLDVAEDARLLARVAELGFVVSADDPRVHAIACSGAPACASACGETRVLAAELAGALAPLLTKDARFHVSGCSKACAWNGRADVTLVHASDGVRLALDASVAEAESEPVLSLAELRERLSLLHLTAQAACAHEASESTSP